uniref:Uncharacterized protein n=1 Tax=Ditylenchus dipsaci TaxID=166011 RepID=A0A915DXR7_9BILA
MKNTLYLRTLWSVVTLIITAPAPAHGTGSENFGTGVTYNTDAMHPFLVDSAAIKGNVLTPCLIPQPGSECVYEGNIVSNDSNNQLSQDSLELATAATNENVSIPNNNALVDTDGATSMQSSSFVAHTLFQTQTNTGNIFDHPSEQREPPPKSKKIIIPFAPEATVPLLDLLPCWLTIIILSYFI